ncbi:MAG: UvrD-helicase domain-containing protein [Candidatus Andersenbacteria bacterium]
MPTKTRAKAKKKRPKFERPNLPTLAGLNDRQAEAVLHTDGALLILAGAGSGKTKALTHRIAHLITQVGIPPGHILAVTFTNKAAGEMRQRLKDQLANVRAADGRGAELPFVGTFHSLGVRLLHREGVRLGYGPRFAIYDTEDQIATIKAVLAEQHLDPKQFNPNLLLSLISRAKNELLGPEEVAARADEFLEEVAAKVYTRYQARLKDANAVDFDDLLVLPVRLFREFPEVLSTYQDRFRYIHVDEYQDTNHAQYTLIRLAEARGNVAVVGDDWQAIYGSRRAPRPQHPRVRADFPDAHVVLLEQNYRSTRRSSTRPAQSSPRTRSRKIKSSGSENGAGSRLPCTRPGTNDEAEHVLRPIRKAQQHGVTLDQSVVLGRTNAQFFHRGSLPAVRRALPHRGRHEVLRLSRQVKDAGLPSSLWPTLLTSSRTSACSTHPRAASVLKTRSRTAEHAQDKHAGDLLAAMLDASSVART